MSAATGPSGATAALTLTLPLRSGSWSNVTKRNVARPKPSLPQTPVALGYRMPGEWEPHAATWMAWPHNRADWPGKFAAIPWVYAEIIRNLVRVEQVNILVNDEVSEASARNVLVTADVLPKNAVEPGSRS